MCRALPWPGDPPTICGRRKVVILAESCRVKLVAAAILLASACNIAMAATLPPLPRPRPAEAHGGSPTAVLPKAGTEPSACRLRLTEDLAIAPSLPPIEGPGECGGPDLVRLEAVVLSDKTRVAVTPPATLRCSMAEAIVRWVRDDVAPALQPFGAPLKSVDNYASFDCRGRNNIAGAKLSEHGKANALDVRSFKLADGKLVRLVDPHISRAFREDIRKSVCGRFSTVLGPGSDGYHEDHVHMDLMNRAPGRFKMCQWDVRDPEPVAAASASVPLPVPRPKIEARPSR